MDKKLIQSEIDTLLGIIQQQHWLLNDTKGRIPQIDIDLLLENTRKLYAQILLLNAANSGQESYAEVVTIPTVTTNEAATPEIKPPSQPMMEAVPTLNPPIEKLNANIGATQGPIAKAPEMVVVETIAPAEVQEEEKTPAKPFSASVLDRITSIADRFKGGEPSLHDKISKGKDEKGLADQFQHKAIADLSSAMGMNERFQFINGIFKGDSQAFSTSLDFINKCTSMDNAQQFIDHHLKPQFNWDMESEQVQQFMELVARRFL